jgi:hypothetical protein
MRKTLISAAIGSAAAMVATPLLAQDNSGRRFTVALEGEQEVGGRGGDLDGTGTATLRINPGRGQLCYTIRVSGIAPANAAHIHEAPAGTNGGVIVPLNAPTNGTSSGCATVSRELALEIIRDPADYYVNVHNAEFPGGALRGQLDR